jgi:hypothetical protein
MLQNQRQIKLLPLLYDSLPDSKETSLTDTFSRMADENRGGNTALHRACGDRRSTFEDIQRLIDEDPQALAKPGLYGNTPLHWACMFLHQSPDILQVLLDRSPVQVLGMCNGFGQTTLHLACLNRVSIDNLRQMIRMYPKALRMITTYGYTPLQCASQRASLEASELLILHCPEATLIIDDVTESPYDRVVFWRRNEPAVLSFVQAATLNAVLAFFVCARETLITVSPAVISHIRQAIPGLFEDSSSMSYMNNNEAIRHALHDHETLKNLLQNDDLQSLLKQEDCQDLIRGVYPMVQAGRTHASPESFKHHMFIMEAVSDSPDFMYMHLLSHLFSLLPDR